MEAFDAGSDAGFTEILNPSALEKPSRLVIFLQMAGSILGSSMSASAMPLSLTVLASFVQSRWLDWDRCLSPLLLSVSQGPHAACLGFTLSREIQASALLALQH
jgi:hypothetical protein